MTGMASPVLPNRLYRMAFLSHQCRLDATLPFRPVAALCERRIFRPRGGASFWRLILPDSINTQTSSLKNQHFCL
jgi:hypothetical protein